jgi:hypothetical protein
MKTDGAVASSRSEEYKILDAWMYRRTYMYIKTHVVIVRAVLGEMYSLRSKI